MLVSPALLGDLYCFIKQSAFEGCRALGSITIPDGKLTEIEQGAFIDCTSLRSIIIPGSVKTIGRFAFRGCTSLESASLLYGVERVEEGAFANCTSLQRLSLPTSLKSLGEKVIDGCSSLTEFELPYQIAQFTLPSGTGSLTLTINNKAFDFSSWDSNGHLHPALTLRGYDNSTAGTLAKDHSYKFDPLDGHHYTVTEKPATCEGKGLRTSICTYCGNTVKTEIPSLGGHKMQRVTMDNGQVRDACTQCPYYRILAAGSSETPGDGSGSTGSSSGSTGSGSGSTGSGSGSTGSGSGSTGSGSGSTETSPLPKKNATFTSGSFLYRVTVSSKTKGTVSLVKPVKKLSVITIPATVKYKGYTFRVTGILSKAFYKYTSVKTVTLGANISAIGESAFYGCTKLKELTLPAKVKTIGKQAFYKASSLKRLVINSTVLKSVGKQALGKIHKNAVIKVPASKLKTYRTLLKGKGQKSSVKIIKK